MMDLTKAYSGLHFGTMTKFCNIMKPKYGMETAEALIIPCGNNLQKNGSRVFMKYRSLSEINGKHQGLLH